jgi:hypothetical protein
MQSPPPVREQLRHKLVALGRVTHMRTRGCGGREWGICLTEHRAFFPQVGFTASDVRLDIFQAEFFAITAPMLVIPRVHKVVECLPSVIVVHD